MGLAWRAFLAGAVLTAAACGNGFSSSPADAGSTADAGAPDVGATDAGASDATDAADGPDLGSSYCAANMGAFDFCADFDESSDVTPFLDTWTTSSSTGGLFSFDTMNVPSPPNALVATTTSTSGVRTLAIHVMPAPKGPVVRQRLEFDFLVNTATGDTSLAAAAVAAILFGDDVTGGAVALAFGNGTGSADTLEAIFEGPAPMGTVPAFGYSAAPPPFPPLGTWDGRFAIEITYPGPDAGSTASAGACVQLYIGGLAQLSPCLALPPSLSKPAAVTSIALGVFSGGVGDTGSVGVGFDNVTFIGQ